MYKNIVCVVENLDKARFFTDFIQYVKLKILRLSL